jgi:hypothetical protein
LSDASDPVVASAAHLQIAMRVISRAAFEDVFFAGALAVLALLPFVYYLRASPEARGPLGEPRLPVLAPTSRWTMIPLPPE